MDYVRATEAFVVVSALATATSMVFLSLITIARPAPIWVSGGSGPRWGRLIFLPVCTFFNANSNTTPPSMNLQAHTDTLTTGFYALLLSTVCLALCIFAWMVRLSSFTLVLAAAATPTLT